MVNTVILVHETEAQCRERLLAMGFPYGTAVEIASYLAQSTDMNVTVIAIMRMPAPLSLRILVRIGSTSSPSCFDDQELSTNAKPLQMMK